jgi:hypothetical protein
MHDAWSAVFEFAASQHGVVTTRQAAAFGIGRSSLHRLVHAGLLERRAPGAYVVTAVPPTWRTALAVASLSTDATRLVVSHRAAAVLHGLDGIEGPWREVTVRRGSRVAIGHVVVHWTDSLDPADVAFVDGIRCTTLSRTLCDLGAVVSDETVSRALDDAVRRGVGLDGIRTVLDRVDRPGPSGTASLRRVLDRHDGLATDSWFERLVLDVLRAAPGLPAVVPQYRVRDGSGRVVAVVDLAFPEHRVAIEAHSKRWHFGERKNVLDADRDLALQALDWAVGYVRHDEARRRAVVIDKARRLLNRRGAVA